MLAHVPRRFLFCSLIFLISLLANGQLHPWVVRLKAEAAKPAQLVIQTSSSAEVYLDDIFRGKASSEGRLVIDNPQPREHALRVSLAGKRESRQNVTIVAGQETRIEVLLESNAPPSPVETRRNSEDGLMYVWIPPGNSMMGCSPEDDACFDNEKPAHQVTITRGFWIGQTPVTVGAYKRFTQATKLQIPRAPSSNSSWIHEEMPIVMVSWENARDYCEWMGGRLPTEAEWEYAARGGSTEPLYGLIDEIAWYRQNSLDQTHDVAEKRANSFGLYDMLGNVLEWVNDWYEVNYYEKSPTQDPQGPSRGQCHVTRGGAGEFPPPYILVSRRRGDNSQDIGCVNVGFRCVGKDL